MNLASAIRSALLALLFLASAAARGEAPTTAVVDKPVQELWKHRCANCHGAGGEGPGHKRENIHIPDFRAAEWQKKRDDKFIAETIREGIRERHMPAFKNKLTPEQIDGLVALIRTFKR